MTKSKFMRVAAVLMAAVLLTTCAISGTFAKYTTTVNGVAETARVAKWGITSAAQITIADLFNTTAETGKAVSSNSDEIIAPGTTGSASFAFAPSGIPEVAYSITIDTTGSSCDQAIQDNANIQWKLDDGSWGTWAQLLTAIAGLSETNIAPNTAPTNFATSSTTHTVAWQWVFETTTGEGQPATQDGIDTGMGNTAATGTADDVTLVINFTAVQVD